MIEQRIRIVLLLERQQSWQLSGCIPCSLSLISVSIIDIDFQVAGTAHLKEFGTGFRAETTSGILHRKVCESNVEVARNGVSNEINS